MTTDPDDILQTIREAVDGAWPYPSSILTEIYNAVADNTWTPLPAGSHLMIQEAGKWKRGVGVVAMQNRCDRTSVINVRGERLTLSEDFTLAIGQADA